MSNDKIEGEQSENDSCQSSEVISIGYFNWFVLVTYVIFSASLAKCELIFAPIPKQTAAYNGILGTYFEFLIEKTYISTKFYIFWLKIMKKVNQVDWFYIVQMLVHLPVGLFTLYFVDFIGLKKSFWISTSLNVIGTALRLGRVSKRWLFEMITNNEPD